jgi:hypothetical protein
MGTAKTGGSEYVYLGGVSSFDLRLSRVVSCLYQTIFHDILQAADVRRKIHRNYVCCAISGSSDFIRHAV